MLWSEYDPDPKLTIEGRPDFHNHDFGVTYAKKFPPYVFGTSKMCSLVHRIVSVELRWYVPGGHRGECLIRLRRPMMLARTACGNVRFLQAKRSRTCLIPNPDALMCGRCIGELATFGKHGAGTKAGISRSTASAKLGCVVQGY